MARIARINFDDWGNREYRRAIPMFPLKTWRNPQWDVVSRKADPTRPEVVAVGKKKFRQKTNHAYLIHLNRFRTSARYNRGALGESALPPLDRARTSARQCREIYGSNSTR
jgi:hypothetical protein